MAHMPLSTAVAAASGNLLEITFVISAQTFQNVCGESTKVLVVRAQKVHKALWSKTTRTFVL
jgi:hypothetical protein